MILVGDETLKLLEQEGHGVEFDQSELTMDTSTATVPDPGPASSHSHSHSQSLPKGESVSVVEEVLDPGAVGV